MMKPLMTYLIVNVIFYLVGSFIALDFNPANWDMIKDTFGRAVFIWLQFAVIVCCWGIKIKKD